jgi:excisionase family DNA binding protein
MEFLPMHTNTPTLLAYGITQAVEATSVGRSLLYEQIKAGNLKTFKIGTRTLIATEDLVAWLEQYKTPHPDTSTPFEGDRND